MLGFTARALTTEMELRDDELEDAQWFTRADLKSGRPLVPPSVSISFRLIEHWFDRPAGRKLREILQGSRLADDGLAALPVARPQAPAVALANPGMRHPMTSGAALHPMARRPIRAGRPPSPNNRPPRHIQGAAPTPMTSTRGGGGATITTPPA